MERSLKSHVESLLNEAELAADEKANGLMDRADFQHIIARLAQTTRQLMETCEHLEQDCNSYSSRLNRKPHLRPMEALVEYGKTEVQPV